MKKFFKTYDTDRRGGFDVRAAAHQKPISDEELQDFVQKLRSISLLTRFDVHLSPSTSASSNPAFHDTVRECCEVLDSLYARVENRSAPIELVETRGQGDSRAWIKERSTRVTSSTSKRVLGLQSGSAKSNFLLQHVWDMNRVLTPAMIYGTEHEPIARSAYAEWLKKEYPSAELLGEVGLCVHPDFPQLGCSPDGLVLKNGEVTGLLEIKCPFTLKDTDVSSFDTVLSKSQLSGFCLRKVRGKTGKEVLLKTSHSHYYQIQMSMDICRVPSCHFVVWSSVNFYVFTVSYDEEFWSPRRSSLVTIHRQLIVPEIVLKNTLKGKAPVEISYRYPPEER